MPLKIPKADSFTEKIKNITPGGLDGKSAKIKTDFISDTVNSITSEITDKVCGLIDLAIDIQSGISKIASSLSDVNLESFINTGVAAVKDTLEDAKDLITDTTKTIAGNAKNILSEIDDQIKNIDDTIIKGVETAKLAAQGLVDTAVDIAKFPNKLIRDISLDGGLKSALCDEEINKAKNDMVNSAKKQVSQFKISDNQNEKITSASKDLLDDVKILEKEQLSEFEIKYSDLTPIDKSERFVDFIDPNTGEVIGIEDRVSGVIRPV